MADPNDPDVLDFDDPQFLQPDHDESLNSGLLPDDFQRPSEDNDDSA